MFLQCNTNESCTLAPCAHKYLSPALCSTKRDDEHHTAVCEQRFDEYYKHVQVRVLDIRGSVSGPCIKRVKISLFALSYHQSKHILCNTLLNPILFSSSHSGTGFQSPLIQKHCPPRNSAISLWSRPFSTRLIVNT